MKWSIERLNIFMVNMNCDIFNSSKYEFISHDIKVSCYKDIVIIELGSQLHHLSSIIFYILDHPIEIKICNWLVQSLLIIVFITIITPLNDDKSSALILFHHSVLTGNLVMNFGNYDFHSRNICEIGQTLPDWWWSPCILWKRLFT